MSSLISEKITISQPITFFHILMLASLLTGLNALKPVHIDDNVYIIYANEFLNHPLDPYKFNFGSPYSNSANQLLVPPVLTYYLGTGIKLLGNNPILFKLWLLPFGLLLVGALAKLFSRFTPGYEKELLWLTVLSPALLPSFNCMLEIPVLALGLSALVLAFNAIENSSFSMTTFAGITAGLAIETKYTGLIFLAAIFCLYVIKGRNFHAMLMTFMALAVFVSWELFIFFSQGQSHFIIHLGQRKGKFIERCFHLILPLLTQVGGLIPIVATVGLFACKFSSKLIMAITFAIFMGFLSLAVIPPQWISFSNPETGKVFLNLSNLVYGLMAILVWGTLALVLTQLFKMNSKTIAHSLSSDRQLNWFLVIWLILELGGYFVLSPFPAARRVLGITLVITFLIGRLLSQTTKPDSSRILIRLLTCAGVTLGTIFFTSDFLDAKANQNAAKSLAQKDWNLQPNNTHWHLTWWGLNYYADQVGLKQLILNQTLPIKGDIISAQDNEEILNELKKLTEIKLSLIEEMVTGDSFPLRTAPHFYGGRTPIEHNLGNRVRVKVFRVE